MTMNATHVERGESRSSVKLAFAEGCIRLKLTNILPLKVIRPGIKSTIKYQQIAASIEEVGLVEAPVVTKAPKQPGQFYLVDGHLRLVVIRDLGWTEVDCLLTGDDDTYTYNKRINRLSTR